MDGHGWTEDGTRYVVTPEGTFTDWGDSEGKPIPCTADSVPWQAEFLRLAEEVERLNERAVIHARDSYQNTLKASWQERARIRSILQAALDRLTGAGSQCPAFVRHGPGHQSTTRCQVKGPHEIHEARYGGGDTLAQWRGETFTTGYFDEGQDLEEDDKVAWTAAQELIEALKAEIARTGGGA